LAFSSSAVAQEVTTRTVQTPLLIRQQSNKEENMDLIKNNKTVVAIIAAIAAALAAFAATYEEKTAEETPVVEEKVEEAPKVEAPVTPAPEGDATVVVVPPSETPVTPDATAPAVPATTNKH